MDLVVLGQGSDIEHSLLGSDDRGLLRSGGRGLLGSGSRGSRGLLGLEFGDIFLGCGEEDSVLGCLAFYAADGIFFRLSGPFGFLSDLICVDACLSG